MTPKSPHISLALQKEHRGEVAISLKGKVISVGRNSLDAFNKAKRNMPGIEEKEFVVTRIKPKYLAV